MFSDHEYIAWTDGQRKEEFPSVCSTIKVRMKSIRVDFAWHFSLHIHLIDAFEALFIIKNRIELTMRVIKWFHNGHAMRVLFFFSLFLLCDECRI